MKNDFSRPDPFYASYKPLIDEWALYDNSDVTPVLIEEGINL